MVPKTYLALDSKLAAPIHDACRRGNLDLLLECLENNIPVNSIDQAGNTALHWACHSGNVECLAKLIERCGNMLTYSLKNRLGDTALHMAAYKGIRFSLRQFWLNMQYNLIMMYITSYGIYQAINFRTRYCGSNTTR